MDIQKLKAELIEEILDTIHEELASMNACASEKAKADDTMEAAVEVKEQTAEDKPAEEKKSDEVIKIETLNSSPAKPTLAPQPEAWRNMSQKDFINWIESGDYRKTI